MVSFGGFYTFREDTIDAEMRVPRNILVLHQKREEKNKK